MNIQLTFCTNLKKILNEKRMRFSELSRMTGISKNSLSNINTMKNTGIRFETIEKIANALNIEPFELFKEIKKD